MSNAVHAAIAEGRIGSRMWLYANYRCNLACTYCLTGSAPDVPVRELEADRMRELAVEARNLGFTALGITGGEPFLRRDMPDIVRELSEILPVLVLSNGTLFTGARLERLRPLGSRDVRLQMSLDSADPIANDEMRGPENFRKVVEAVPLLRAFGIRVRIATTVTDIEPEDLKRLCALHRSLGVPDEDHVVRPIVRRGRARSGGLGEDVTADDLAPELTVTVDGAFWSPFGPTVEDDVLDVDLLVRRGTRPLAPAAEALVAVATDANVTTASDRFT